MPFLKLLVAGFELGSSDVGCDRSANWATTVYQLNVIICLREMEEEWRQVRLLARSLEKWARRRFIILFNGLSMYSLTISTYHHPPDIKFKTDWVDSSDTGEPGGDGWQAVNSSTGGLSSWSRPHQCIAQNLGLGISYLFYSSWFDLINCTGNVINSASLVWYTSEMMNKNEVLCSNPKLVNDCYLFINNWMFTICTGTYITPYWQLQQNTLQLWLHLGLWVRRLVLYWLGSFVKYS